MTHTHQQTKTPQSSSQLPAHSTWSRPVPAFEVEHDDRDVLDIDTQLANAERLGHHAGQLTVQAKRLAAPLIIQRWEMTEDHKKSFFLEQYGHPSEMAKWGVPAPERHYYRLQGDPHRSNSQFYAPWEDAIDQIVRDEKVTKNERNLLAVKRAWCKEWTHLVDYRGGKEDEAYIGYTGPQAAPEEGTWYQGGAVQYVFPPTGKPYDFAAYPITEDQSEGAGTMSLQEHPIEMLVIRAARQMFPIEDENAHP